MASKSPRIRPEDIEKYQTALDFDQLFALSLDQVEILYDTLRREKEKKRGGKPYSAHALKKARLVSLNVSDLLHMFRGKSIDWEKQRKREKDEARQNKNRAPKT